jgi:hypothetical protein
VHLLLTEEPTLNKERSLRSRVGTQKPSFQNGTREFKTKVNLKKKECIKNYNLYNPCSYKYNPARFVRLSVTPFKAVIDGSKMSNSISLRIKCHEYP